MTLSEMQREYGQWKQALGDILEGAEASEYGETIGGLLGGSDRLSDFSQMGKGGGSGPMTHNAYPFGQKTDKLFPLLVAACSGQQSLTRALRQMQRHMDCFAQGRGGSERETVILLTTKWDPIRFEPFEIPFLLSCLDHDLTILLILVTDTGVTEIPFGRFARRLSQSRTAGRELERGLREEQTRRQEQRGALREIDNEIARNPRAALRLRSGLPDGNREYATWDVDLQRRRWEHTVHGLHTTSETGKLSLRDVRALVQKLDGAISAGAPLQSGAMDCGDWELSFQGRTYAGLGLGDFFETIRDAFETLGK